MNTIENTKELKESPRVSTTPDKNLIEKMFNVGAHYGYAKARRHPSTKKYVFGIKNKTEIFDLEKTSVELEKAKAFVTELSKAGKVILFVSSKPEAKKIIKEAAESLDMPYVAGRWIGGTLTNFDSIKKRAEKFVDLFEKTEKGLLDKYTKKEKLLISRDMDALEAKFGGITTMTQLPHALFVVDLKKENIAVKEAQSKNIPVISISSTDCDISSVEYAIPGNDATLKSIEFFVNEIRDAYRAGKK